MLSRDLNFSADSIMSYHIGTMSISMSIMVSTGYDYVSYYSSHEMPASI